MSNVGYATLTVIPSARGIGGKLSGQVNPAMAGVGKKAGGLLGGGLLAGAAKFAGPLAAVFSAVTVVGLVKDVAALDVKAREVVTLFGEAGPVAERSLGEVKAQVRAVSDEFGFAQEVVTEGLYNAISAGVPKGNALEFMQVASKAAVAGVTDVNTSVDGLTTAINAYGLDVGDAGRVSDSFFAAVQGGKTTFGELSDSLFNIGPAAAASKVSLEETNAAIATLTSSGTPTSVATTQIRAALVGLQKPSEELDGIFQKLGFQNAQLAVESEGLGFALAAVKDASGGNNGTLQKLLGSTEAVAAANVLAGTGAEKFRTELERQANAAGATDAAFSTINDSAQRQLEILGTNLRNIGLELAGALLPGINAAAAVISENLGPALQRAKDLLGPFVTAVAGGMQQVAAAFASGGDSIGAGSPFGSAIAGLAGLGQQLIGVFQGSILPTIRQVGEAAATLGPPLQDIAARVLPIIIDAGSRLLAVVGPAFSQIGDLVANKLIPALAGLLPILAPVIAFIVEVLAGAVVGLVRGVLTVVQGVIGVVSGIIGAFVALFSGDWAGLWDSVKLIFSSAWQIIVGLVDVVLNLGILKAFRVGFGLLRGLVSSGLGFIRGLFSSSLGALRSVASGAWSGITGTFSAALSFIRSLVSGALGFVRSVVSGGMSAVRGAFTGGMSAARNAVSSALTAIRGAVSSGLSTVVGLVKALPGRIVAGLGNLSTKLQSAGRDLLAGLIAGITQKVSGAVTAVKDAVGSVIRGAKSALGIASPSRVFRDEVGAEIGAGLALGIDRSAGDVERSVRDLMPSPRVPAGLSARDGARLEALRAGATGQPLIGTLEVHAGERATAQDMAREAVRELERLTGGALVGTTGG